MGPIARVLAFGLTLTFFASPLTAPRVHAQAGPAEVRIREIVVEGNRRVEDATVLGYLAVRPGDPFDPDRLDRSLKTLFATGLFEDVRLERRGDVLVVRVVENPVVSRVAFEGNSAIDDEQLRAEVGIAPRSVFSRRRVQEAVERILDLYRRNGRYAARVEPKIIRRPQNRVDLVFEIREGPVTRVCGIAFVGNRAFSDSTLRGVVSTRETAWYRFFSSADVYDPDRVELDKERLRRHYRARGYAEFEVTAVTAQLGPDGRCYYLTFAVDEGPRYRFGKVELVSDIPELEPEKLRRLVEVREGGIYDADAIERTVQAITEKLGELGYAFARIEPEERLDREKRVVDIVFRISRGPRVYVERIEIRGNVRTLDRVIRREFRLAEGDPFNASLLRRSIQRVRNLGYFSRVDVRTRQGSAPDRLVVEVEVEEQPTGELSFGGGYSTAEGFLADARLSERNLLGRGQKLDLSFTVSGRTTRFDFSFTEPYFLGHELSAGIDLFHTVTDFQTEASFDQRRDGGRIRVGYPLSEFLRHSVRYALRRIEIDNVDPAASAFIRREQGGRVTSAIGHTLKWDRRDNVFLPSEGFVVRIDQDFAGLGGDNRYVRHELRAAWYYSVVPDVVVNLGIRAGHILGLGGDVHLADRFFIGGSTLRGFRFAGIGPRDRTTGDALGGNLYYVGTAELRFPLGLPKELRMFGRAFVDAGTLTDVDVSGPNLVDSGDVRVGAGVGVSWVSPLGPLSIDFAQAVVKNDEDETERFRLSFGTRF